MTNKYDALVLIGRFQPFHDGHLGIVRRATTLTDNLIVIAGSAYQPRTYKNPFTFHEREWMIRDAASNYLNVNVFPNVDTIYNDQAWAVRIQKIVADAMYSQKGPGEYRIAIIGHKKDASSYYLDMFPQWDFVDVEQVEPLGATDIRDLYFRRDANMNFIKNVVPETTFDFLTRFRTNEGYEQVIREREFIENYRKQFAGLPYPPVFVTGDAVVFQSGHVLMIKRRSEPGRGLWALPGGFLNAATDRSVVDCAIRELREETGLKVPEPVLRGNIQDVRVFDAVDRSARGRTITHAVNIVLPDGELPRVRGQDDAEKARWVAISDVHSEECFEDHAEIINTFLGS